MRHKRRLVIGLGVVALLVALYAAAGYLLAPSLIRNALVERASRAGLELRVGAIHTHPFSLVLEAKDVKLASAKGEPLAALEQLSADLAWSSLWQRTWVVQRVQLDAPVLLGVPTPGEGSGTGTLPALQVDEVHVVRGELALPGLPRLEAIDLTANGLSTAHDSKGSLGGTARISGGGTVRTDGSLSIAPLALAGRLQVSDAALATAWRYLPPTAGAAPAGTLSATFDYRYAGGQLALSGATAQARLAAGGSFRAQGQLETAPFRADLKLAASELPLQLAQRFIPPATPARLAAGSVSADGHLKLGAGAPGGGRFEGALSIAGGRIADAAGAPLIGWERMATSALRIDFAPFAVQAGEITAHAPHGRLAIGPKGELNLAALVPHGGDAGKQGEHARISVDRLSIEQGELDFADHSLETPFATTIRSLAGFIDGLGTGRPEPARVQLAGRVGKYGDARVRGTIDLDAPASRTNLQLRFRNLALPDFTPYAAKFAGYRIEAGRLSANMNYRVRDGKLVGSNQLVFNKLKLGEKVESASALDLPLYLAIALLTDSHGNIDLAIPVSGNLNDPQFDLGGLIAKAVRNTVGRIVSAPFRLLASLLGRPDAEGLDEVAFDPGSSVLSAPEEENLAQVAQALAERPQLALAVRGGYDAQADLQALRREAVSRELARLSGYSRGAAGNTVPADLRDPKTLRMAERLFEQRGAPAGALDTLKSAGPGYPRRLMDALTTRVELGPDAMQSLARSRAEAVRNALVQAHIDPQRISIDAPGEQKARDAGIPTALSLRPR